MGWSVGRELVASIHSKSLVTASMRKSRSKSDHSPMPEWATSISDLCQRLSLNQTNFGRRLHFSDMGVSRREPGVQDPPSHSYIELGNLAGIQ
jgi:hypothetical protein